MIIFFIVQKLSVGGDDDDNDDCEESEMNEADQLRARMREWHQSCGPARNDVSSLLYAE